MKRRFHFDILCSTSTFAGNLVQAVKNKLDEYDIYVRDLDAERTGTTVRGMIRFGAGGDAAAFKAWVLEKWDDARILAGSRISVHDCRHEEPGTSWPACVEDDVLVK